MLDSIFSSTNPFFKSVLNLKELNSYNFCNEFLLVCFSEIVVFKTAKTSLRKSDKPVETISVY